MKQSMVIRRPRNLLLFANTLLLLILTCSASAGFRVKTIHSFNEVDGYRPYGPLVRVPSGELFGTTLLGGVNEYGVLFRVSPDGSFRRLASFYPTNGVEPYSGLVLGTNGYFYGTTTMGGTNLGEPGLGTVFQASRSGNLKTLVSFTGTNGASPYAALIQGFDGNFYGTTYLGGRSNLGTVFKMNPNGDIATLVAFSGVDGAHPYASSLIQSDDGALYGTASTGGLDFAPYWGGFGTVFKITPDGSLVTLHNFDGADGGSPMAFIQNRDGNFYGTTYFGGSNNWGTVFKITPAGDLTVLHSFTGQGDGCLPSSAMTVDRNGIIYGATTYGGKVATYSGFGTIFQIDTNDEVTTIYRFDTVTNKFGQPLDGFQAFGLTAANDGSIYGTAAFGGAFDNIGNGGHGTVFRLRRIKPVVTTSKRDYETGFAQQIAISGSARGVPAITNVFFSLNGAPWMAATSSNRFKTWSANVAPTLVKNILRIYAVDSAGDMSRTNSVNVFCASPYVLRFR